MIKSFKCKETEKIFDREYSRKFSRRIQKKAMRKLWLVDAAAEINDLRVPPSNHLEKLVGDRKGQYSIRINKKWRICFIWRHKDAYDIEIVNYH
ncbi:MAG: type II toxin-antitoxin system RelE/ParE family toxin [Patescibacteria group bacterium]